MTRADDLTAIEPFLGTLLARLNPAQRRRLALKMGRHLRRENAARIARNVQPDGSAMEPRKRRTARKAGRVKNKGRMFPKLSKIRALKIRAAADGVELGFADPAAARTAEIHHFGLVGFVGRSAAGEAVRTRYPARQLLGFGAGDMDALMDVALDHLTA